MSIKSQTKRAIKAARMVHLYGGHRAALCQARKYRIPGRHAKWVARQVRCECDPEMLGCLVEAVHSAGK